MPHPHRLLFLAVLVMACATPPVSGPPSAGFLLAAGDSTYWVASGPSGVRVRGSPLMLARYGGRFHELYVADDDRSYYDALLVGQGVYSRDLISGDSTLVYSDTLVARIADAYATAHADEDPLEADDPVADRPAVVATSDISLLDVHGPFLSIEYHADTRVRPRAAFHTTWRTVIDLRVGHPVPIESLVGGAEAERVLARARQSYDAALDSARAGAGAAEFGDIVRVVLSQVAFDPRSFSLTALHGKPAVAFAGRIAGRRDGRGALPLPAIPIDSASWWGDVRATLPVDAEHGTEQWVRSGYTVRAVPDTADSLADIAIVDSARRVWPVARVHGPLRRVFWLDRPAADSTTRRALDRAFNAAALYDENARVAALHRPAAASPLHPAGFVQLVPRPVARPSARQRHPTP